MAIDQQVLVIGGGISGLTATLAAAREGVDVRLVSAAETTLHHASGLLDVLGSLPESDEPVVDPFAAMEDLPAEHPYSIVGESAVRSGLAMIDDALGGAYCGGHTDRNALVVTYGGECKPTARYPASVAPGLASDDRATLFVGFERETAFDAETVAASVTRSCAFDARAATVAFPVVVRDDPTARRFAHLLDRNERVEGRSIRAALADAIAPHVGDAERIGLPAVLGIDEAAAVRATLEDRLDATVFEVPMGPPSVLGRRLERRLYAAVEAAGARVETGRPVVDFDATRGSIDRVSVDRSGQRIPYAADEVVLATGGVAGGGITDDGRLCESIFDCHVAQPDDPTWAAADPFGDHAFARAGVTVDDRLRPLDRSGTPEYDTLRAAGSVLGGFDPAAELSGSGVSIATGYAAGTAAAREVLA
ncbi:glycerol-3-phosphate dehydrogenase subunit GlpB [Halococcoides cellulosivorans]|uniref:Anaerobic glycerol-3-phosphate dehydrogenase subunit B n=1 Tax=Halococcoides cellulosivorans TaxID=1679096 RepID=A0A2R4WZF6_9EURY|nr:glycerol-3-phosphate dehydrogenase subunit GlpB [Halococcoides cellulosivorans]AWB26923.1 anaerobic glycerol-3-phosphate dehydrogenase subunit B [Halococcoides cellulosivorans]